jgi:hypothetical protein
MADVRIHGTEPDASALPKPKRTLRTITLAVMVATALASALLAWALRDDARYAIERPAAVELPDHGPEVLAQHEGRFVRTRVTLGSPVASFRRPFEPSRYQLAKVEGSEPLYVVYSFPDGYEEQRFLPPALVAGRLVRADRLGPRFRGLGSVVAGGAWVIIDGEDPHGGSWLLGLEALLLVFLAFNVVAIARVVRRVS